MIPAFRAVDRLPIGRKAARTAFRPWSWTIRGTRTSFRAGRGIVQDPGNGVPAGLIA
jgi:hypothetical protein